MDALVRKDTHVKTGTGEHCPALVDTYACRLHKRPVIRRMASTSFSYGSKRAGRAWGSVCTLLLLLLLIFTATAHAVPPGTVIDNTAQALFRANGIDTTISSNSVSITTTWMRTPSQIELLQYAPSVGGAEQVLVPTTDYSPDGTTGGAPQTIAAVYPAGSTTPIDLSSAVPLVPVVYYHQGEPVFIRVVDMDQNIDPAVAETIWVQLTTPDLGDIELLLLTETEPDSGIFAGYMQSSGFGPVQAYNGLLDVTEGARISAQYIDAADSNDSVAASILVDPYGLVFDSSTGQPVGNATVTLVNAATGQPAVVYGDDGVSTFPSTRHLRRHLYRQQRQGVCICQRFIPFSIRGTGDLSTGSRAAQRLRGPLNRLHCYLADPAGRAVRHRRARLPGRGLFHQPRAGATHRYSGRPEHQRLVDSQECQSR